MQNIPSAADADTPKIIQLAQGFYVRQEVDNITWIDLGEYAVVIDALEQASLEREVFETIDSTLAGRPVRYVLNTHTHYDHVSLNDAFLRRWGSEIVNMETSPLGSEGRWFEGSRRRVLMLPLPGCHTEEDCVVWAPNERVLMVGDIFGWGLIPLVQNLRADTLKLLEDTYARLIEFDAQTVVPGHGPLCTTATLGRWVEYVHWLIREVKEAVAAGRSDEEILRQIAPPDDMSTWWRFLKWKHQDSLAKVLKPVRKDWL